MFIHAFYAFCIVFSLHLVWFSIRTMIETRRKRRRWRNVPPDNLVVRHSKQLQGLVGAVDSIGVGATKSRFPPANLRVTRPVYRVRNPMPEPKHLRCPYCTNGYQNRETKTPCRHCDGEGFRQ